MKEEWLMSGAVVPANAETTVALVAEIHKLIGVVGNMALAQALQEPVAWVYPEGLDALKAGKPWTAYGTRQEPNNTALYLSPQPDIPPYAWVGLTDEEIQECLKGLPTETIDVYAKRIEQALKDKNT